MVKLLWCLFVLLLGSSVMSSGPFALRGTAFVNKRFTARFFEKFSLRGNSILLAGRAGTTFAITIDFGVLKKIKRTETTFH